MRCRPGVSWFLHRFGRADRPYVHASGDQFGRGEVSELVDVHVPAQTLAHTAVSLGHGVGLTVVLPSGELEKTKASSPSSTPSSAC